MQISCAVTAQLISVFVFAMRIVQSLYYLNPKFQASSHLLSLYNPVCVGPGRKSRRPVFLLAAHILSGNNTRVTTSSSAHFLFPCSIIKIQYISAVVCYMHVTRNKHGFSNNSNKSYRKELKKWIRQKVTAFSS